MHYSEIENGFVILDEDNNLVVFKRDETGFTFTCNPPNMTWSVISTVNGTKVLEENEEFLFAFEQAKAIDFTIGKVFTNPEVIKVVLGGPW